MVFIDALAPYRLGCIPRRLRHFQFQPTPMAPSNLAEPLYVFNEQSAKFAGSNIKSETVRSIRRHVSSFHIAPGGHGTKMAAVLAEPLYRFKNQRNFAGFDHIKSV